MNSIIYRVREKDIKVIRNSHSLRSSVIKDFKFDYVIDEDEDIFIDDDPTIQRSKY